jgi:signal transduction histidine kinase/CheY-like chemotaxis protein
MVASDGSLGLPGAGEGRDGHGASENKASAAVARSDAEFGNAHTQLPETKEFQQRAGLARLTDEIARLRIVESERDTLLAQNQLLCGANENLVLATLAAQALRDEAKAANQRQNEFLAMLAHELRNPLAPISMAASMLARTPSPSTQLGDVQKIIARQVRHLARLLDDLLDAARINSGKITLVRTPIVLADQLRSAAQTVQVRMNERGQQLQLHVPPANIMVDGDAVRLAQVFSNLLVNASKFTQDGGSIVVSAWMAEDKVMITFADNGEGISSEVIPNVFSLFTQGPRSLARSEGGLGVGLNVVRNVVEMHGGTVEASSPGLGHGSVFTLALPLLAAVAPPVSTTPEEAPGRQSHRILLVEDNRDASELLTMFLRSVGYTVVTAFDGPSGLATALAQHFDVLVCDIGLPGLDGYSLMRALSDAAGTMAPYAIAVSGYGQLEDRALAIAAGFAKHLVKPIDVNALLSLIESAPARRSASRG